MHKLVIITALVCSLGLSMPSHAATRSVAVRVGSWAHPAVPQKAVSLLKGMAGVLDATASYDSNVVQVVIDDSVIAYDEVCAALRSAGFKVFR